MGIEAASASATSPPVLREVECEQRRLVVTWEDGRVSAFHHLWLRDNCACVQCGDRSATSGERFLSLVDLPAEVTPAAVHIDDGHALRITWAGDRHRSAYPSAWLRAHAYATTISSRAQSQRVLWDATLGDDDSPQADYSEVHSNEDRRLRLFELVDHYGFAVLRHVPCERGEVERLASLFGFIRETNYGRVFDIATTPNNVTLAQTNHAIAPHNDELFRFTPPGLIAFHCLVASECGGGASILVDGFRAAEALRAADPVSFELLTRVPLPHRRYIAGKADHRADTPMIRVDARGELVAFQCNERTMAPLELAEDLIEPVYAAVRWLLERLYEPGARITIPLRPGDALVFDNQRVLHARTAFTGARHVRQCHVDRDEFESRLRLLRHRR